MEPNIESLSSQEKISFIPQWSSAYNPVALETLEKVTRDKIRRVHPEATEDYIKKEVLPKREKLKVYLDAIDQEFIDNFGIFTSESDPEVRFPYTSISIKNVVNRVYPQKTEFKEETKGSNLRKRKLYVVFTPFSPPGGDPSDAINTIYDRALLSLPAIRKKEDIVVYALGLPTSKWGSVSDEWVGDLEKGISEKEDGMHGFSQHARLYAEFLRPIFNKYLEDPQTETSIIFRGDSMDTILASKTAGELPEIWENLRLLLDVPTGVHKPAGKTIKLPFIGAMPLSLKGLQVVAGFSTEVLLRALTDDLVRKALYGKKQGLEELTGVLSNKSIIPNESKEQNKLKRDAWIKEIKLSIRGTPMDTDSFRSHIVQAMLDPAVTDPKKLLFLLTHTKNKRFFKAGSRSLGMGVNYTHWMDRGRWPQRWIWGIERYESYEG